MRGPQTDPLPQATYVAPIRGQACSPDAGSALPYRVLIVDDNLSIHEDFQKVLSPAPRAASDKLTAFREAFNTTPEPQPKATTGVKLSFACQGEEAVEMAGAALAEGAPFALAFVDMRMPPGIDGLETARRLWAADPNLQVVICSAYSDYSWESMVERLGSGDRWVILRKPFDPVAARQLTAAMTCKWRSSQVADLRADELTALVEQRTADLRRSNAALKREMTSLERAQARIDHMTHHDSLTELPNRLYLEQHLQTCIEDARERGHKVALLSVDIDHFKRINDSLGHTAGDEVLRHLANRLKDSIRNTDFVYLGDGATGSTVARFGGDEFFILLPEVETEQDVLAAAGRLEARISQPLEVGAHQIRVTTSMGISLYPDHGATSRELISNADCAMRSIKQRGRGEQRVYDPSLTRTPVDALMVEAGLIRALEHDELRLHYQPIVDLKTLDLIGLEALVRWQHPTEGLLPPGRFLPLAEEVGLIEPIGTWALNHACVQARAWLDKGFDFGHISVNVSARQLSHKGLSTVVASALAKSGLPSNRLVIELTETALLTQGFQSLRCIVDTGVRIALDDFGTGYSSLKHLVQLPIYALKIDASFVRDAHHRPQHAAVVQAIIGMAQSMGLAVVAEGVECLEELNLLETHGCRAIQGFLFSRPMAAEDLPEAARRIKAGLASPTAARATP